MEESLELNNKDYKIIDILHQIEKLNSMVLLHSQDGGIQFMKEQYEEMKAKLLVELNEELKKYIGNASYAMAA